MADCHPILFLRMMDRVKAGAKLIVVDPRRTGTADKADLFLQIRPGTDLALTNGCCICYANGRTDAAFIDAYTEGWDAMPAFSPTTRPSVSPTSPPRKPTCARPRSGSATRRNG